MKNLYAILSFLLLIVFGLYSYYGVMPRYKENSSSTATNFSVERAIIPLLEIGKKPHYLGSEAHAEVRKTLIRELQKLGLQPHIQEGFSLNPEAKSLSKPINILAKISGSEKGKALLLLSHYDSAAIYSHGVSDDGVGIVSILESLRAYLASGAKPKNDIIILFTDAEELGLDGAKLFVEEHPWAKEVGLVLNFEARGTSGPSNMILETNQGNAKLLQAFKTANTPYPVASSLMYSVYKLLPNDTDSTIFREDADIDSFFFAFIDNHFNYHTANDNLQSLDWDSLAHQGSYLVPLLHYFSDANLSDLKSNIDYVYTNFPIIKILSYPFSWIFPMLILAIGIFGTLIAYGLQKKRLQPKTIFKGFLLFSGALLLSGIIGFYGWKTVLWLYPHYNEIQQGFTYNGHIYISLFISIPIAICFAVYHKFTSLDHQTSLFLAPLFLWILLNVVISIILKGAAYFIIPVFFGLLTFYLLLRKSQPNILLLSILNFPAFSIFVPLIQYFPVGLGLKMLVLSSIFTVLLFGLLLPIFLFYKAKPLLAIGFGLLSLGFILFAHTKSSFSPERQKPNSLVYYADANTKKAYWLSYDNILDDWTSSYLGEKPETANSHSVSNSYSKYGRAYTYAKPTDWIEIPKFEIRIEKDSLIGDTREISFTILPTREVHRLEVYKDSEAEFKSLSFNGKSMPLHHLSNTYRGTKNTALINYHLSPGDSLEISYSLSKDEKIPFRVLEYSYNLMDNPYFKISKRPDYTIPKPFVVTDAIAVKREFVIGM